MVSQMWAQLWLPRYAEMQFEGTDHASGVHETAVAPQHQSRNPLLQKAVGFIVFVVVSVGVAAFIAASAMHPRGASPSRLQLPELVALDEETATSLQGIPPLIEGTCPNYSPTWPSAGGPDCSYACPNGSRSVGTAFYNPFPPEYAEKIIEAGKLVRSIDPEHTVYTEGSGPGAFMDSHISFSYYCCHTESELSHIKSVLEKWDGWRPRSVDLSHVTCAIDGPSIEHVSFIVMLDSESNRVMMQWVAELEEHLRKAGVKIHIPRRNQEPYHTTLAVVNGSGYPTTKAIEAVNARFPPGKWLKKPMTLQKPCNAHSKTPEGFFC